MRGNDIGIIFQEPMTSLNPLHTIERQVGEVLKVHRGMGETAARARTLELLEQVGIRDAESRLGAYPHQLSGGQRQRVMIAMALANEPDLLIADEPTTALDVTVQAQILKLLADLQKQTGMAMLFITHDLGIVRRIASRVCVMTGGQIVEQGADRGRSSPTRSTPIRAICWPPSRRATRRIRTPQAPVVMEADKLKVWFPIKRGFLRKTVGYIKAVDGIDVDGAARADARRGRRIGLRQDDARPRADAADLVGRAASSFSARRSTGSNFKEMRPLRRDMQIVFQDPYGSLSPAHVGRRHRRRGAEGPRAAPLAAASATGAWPRRWRRSASMPATRNRYPHEFSGGQRQRIAVARAMVLEPEFVMLDEPTSALDMSVQAQVVDLLRELQRRHDLAYLFISHDLKVVRALANDIIVMRDGKVVEQGPAAQVFDNPKTDYTGR